MAIKDLIRNNIVSHAIDNGQNMPYQIAKVLKADEKNNVCEIQYKDSKDRERIRKNVPVRIYSNSMIDWFPEQNEFVTIEVLSGDPIIIGTPEAFMGIASRSENTLESDIYSDNMTCNTEGGYIY